MTKEEAIKVLSESIHDGSIVPWDKIVEAAHLSIEALSQPSLPSNLDEAAEEYLEQYNESEFGNGGDDWDDDIRITFKAGAEWMAEQMKQEQPEVDLEKEIRSMWKKCEPTDEGMGVESAYMHIEAFDIIARHFYELGKNSK